MTKPKQKQPLDSFDPRMLQLLIQGARRRIIVPFNFPGGKALAHSFQRRLHTLRARLRQEDHEHARLCSRCYVRLLWGSKLLEILPELPSEWYADEQGKLGAYIAVQPMDMVFDSVLSKLQLPATPNLKLEPITPEPEQAADDLESWLKTLRPKDPSAV